MNALDDPTMNAISPDATTAALREVFRVADKSLRQKLVPILPPDEVSFAGVTLYVDPRDNYTDRRIWMDGQPPELTSLNALIDMVADKNAFILDIGANIGAYTVPLAHAAGEGSRLIAFEPNPVMIGRLGHNIRLNDLGHVIRIEGCALGAEAGEAVLNFRARNFGQASLNPIRKRVRSGGTIVPIRALSDFAHEADGHDISLLKIDVEGAEVEALCPLLDAGGWLPDAMLIETAHADEWSVDLVGKIKSLGYETTLEADGNTLFTR